MATEKLIERDANGLIVKIVERDLAPSEQYAAIVYEKLQHEIVRAEATAAFAGQAEPKRLVCRITVPSEFDPRRVMEALGHLLETASAQSVKANALAHAHRLEVAPAASSGWRKLDITIVRARGPEKKTALTTRSA